MDVFSLPARTAALWVISFSKTPRRLQAYANHGDPRPHTPGGVIALELPED
jgi:hypothetical protein